MAPRSLLEAAMATATSVAHYVLSDDDADATDCDHDYSHCYADGIEGAGTNPGGAVVIGSAPGVRDSVSGNVWGASRFCAPGAPPGTPWQPASLLQTAAPDAGTTIGAEPSLATRASLAVSMTSPSKRGAERAVVDSTSAHADGAAKTRRLGALDAGDEPPSADSGAISVDSDDGLDAAARALRREIITRSQARTWQNACAEWTLRTISSGDVVPAQQVGAGSDDGGSGKRGVCLCGTHPVFQGCRLVNVHTDAEVEVDVSCVGRFAKSAIGLRAQCAIVHESLFRMHCDPWAARPAVALLELAVRERAIDGTARTVIASIVRVRPSDRQLALLVRTNVAILNHFSRVRPHCAQCAHAMALRFDLGTGLLFYGCPGYPRCRFTLPDPLARRRGSWMRPRAINQKTFATNKRDTARQDTGTQPSQQHIRSRDSDFPELCSGVTTGGAN